MALNGRFPDSLLAYLGWPEVDHLRLVPAAAVSITRLAAAFEAAFSKPLYLSDAYRTYAQQVYLKAIKGVFAATPGTSVHGLGLAIDVASRVNVDGSDEHRWMEANAPAYGWVNPAWAVDFNPYNGQHEPWHWEYTPADDTHPTPTPAQEDDMPLTDADHAAIRGDILSILREQEIANIITAAADTGSFNSGLRLWREPEIGNTLATAAERAVVAHPASTDAAAIAAAIPTDIARQVADMLAARLVS